MSKMLSDLVQDLKVNGQYISSDGNVVNSSELGRIIQSSARRSLKHLNSVGFMDGGCLIFANAVMDFFKGYDVSLAIVGRFGNNDHVVVKLVVEGKNYYIDADGVASAEEIIYKMERLELNGDKAFIEEYLSTDFLKDKNIESKVLKELRSSVGRKVIKM